MTVLELADQLDKCECPEFPLTAAALRLAEANLSLVAALEAFHDHFPCDYRPTDGEECPAGRKQGVVCELAEDAVNAAENAYNIARAAWLAQQKEDEA